MNNTVESESIWFMRTCVCACVFPYLWVLIIIHIVMCCPWAITISYKIIRSSLFCCYETLLLWLSPLFPSCSVDASVYECIECVRHTFALYVSPYGCLYVCSYCVQNLAFPATQRARNRQQTSWAWCQYDFRHWSSYLCNRNHYLKRRKKYKKIQNNSKICNFWNCGFCHQERTH